MSTYKNDLKQGKKRELRPVTEGKKEGQTQKQSTPSYKNWA